MRTATAKTMTKQQQHQQQQQRGVSVINPERQLWRRIWPFPGCRLVPTAALSCHTFVGSFYFPVERCTVYYYTWE